MPKPHGGVRTLGMPTVKDRLVQQAIGQVLGVQHDPTFSDRRATASGQVWAHMML